MANIGKSVELVMVTIFMTHAALVNVLDHVKLFVRASSRCKILGVRVTGSWSKRGVFTRTTSLDESLEVGDVSDECSYERRDKE